MLVKICIRTWGLTLYLIINSRHVQVPVQLVATLVAPSLFCGDTTQHMSTTSTRLALQNCKMLLLILDMPMKAPPAISSLTRNSTPFRSIEYTALQQWITSTPQVWRKGTMLLRTLDTATKESPDTSIPTLDVVFYHCIDSTVLPGPTTSIPCLLQNATMPVTS